MAENDRHFDPLVRITGYPEVDFEPPAKSGVRQVCRIDSQIYDAWKAAACGVIKMLSESNLEIDSKFARLK
jgi:hypothetical protein